MAACFEQSVYNVSRRTVGAAMGAAGSLDESFEALLLEPVDPFVTGLAADIVTAAHFGHRVETPGAVDNEEELLVHG